MEFQAPAIDYLVLLPLLLVAGTGVLLMFVDLVISEERARRLAPWITMVGLIGGLVASVVLWNSGRVAFTPPGGHAMLVGDNFAVALNVIFTLTGILTILLSYNYLQRTGHDRPEFYMLMMLSLSGMMLMGMANDLILIFLALELLSIPLYILAGFAWPRPESEESAMKYFVLGAFSSAIFVFGVALVYGATGATALPGVVAAAEGGTTLLLLAGAALVLVGFGFKVAAAPFHMWTPDVYEGAPTVVTAFMSVGAKVGGFAALLRILIVALPTLGDTWVAAVSFLAALTLILGNVLAIAQPNIKRMLGYSSIAHAGYILIAVAASFDNPDGISAALFYMFAYTFTNLGAFAVAVAVERKENEGVMLDDYKGLARRYPWIAICMAFFMLSLTGIPPTGGFAAKFFVFRTAIEADLVWLVLVGILTSVISAYYYLRVVFLMYFHDGESEMALKPALISAVAVAAVATLLLGILPGAWWDLARSAVIQSVQTLAAGG
jgi:NADH-quinone oxidoreductase subunit N